jgi:hypothetical protein
MGLNVEIRKRETGSCHTEKIYFSGLDNRIINGYTLEQWLKKWKMGSQFYLWRKLFFLQIEKSNYVKRAG